jgi:4-amino-4-deoxy-L-arabinose transferase-like glycosyltransferase
VNTVTSLRRIWLPTVALGALALLLRTWTLNWGLSYVEHPDEPFYVEIIVRMVRDNTPNPLSFWHPPLLFYILTLVTRGYTAWGGVAELPLKTYFYTTDPGLYVWNRTAVAVLGALTVLLLFQLGRRMFDLRTALLAALLLAVARFHVEHSYYIATSAPTGLFVTLALLGAWEIATTGRLRAYVLLGAAVGLAAATKYNAGPVGFVVLVAHGVYWRRAALREGHRVVISGLAAGGGFLIGNPYALLEWRRFLADLSTQSDAYTAGSGDFTGVGNLAGYLLFLWNNGIGWPGSVVAIAGLPLLIRRSWRQFAVLITPIVILLALLLLYPTHFVRNLLLVYPAIVLIAAASAVALGDWLVLRLRATTPSYRLSAIGYRLSLPIVPWLLLTLAALALIVPQLLSTGWLLRYWSRPHTLAQAADVLREQPRGMLAAVELNPVQWSGDPVVEPLRFLGTFPPEWYIERGYRYLVLNDERYDPIDQPVYDRLIAGGTVLLAMPTRRLGLQPGPGGAVIDLGEHVERIPFVRRNARFGEVAELLGYELRPGEPRARITPLEGADERTLAAGAPLQINLYWRALTATDTDYVLFIHVYDADDQRVAQRDLPLRYADYPTSRWQPGELVIERGDMPLPALPPGDYRLLIGLYDATTGAALPTPDGAPVELATIRIE